MSTARKFDIGSGQWPGLAKVVEEAGELQQVLAKIIATDGNLTYFDGGDLKERLLEELGDLHGALDFFLAHNLSREDRILVLQRAATKRSRFDRWQVE